MATGGINSDVWDDVARDNYMLGFHRQILNHAEDQINRGNDIERYQGLIQKLMNMNQFLGSDRNVTKTPEGTLIYGPGGTRAGSGLGSIGTGGPASMAPPTPTQPVDLPQVAPQPERNKGGYAQPRQPAAQPQPSTVMSSPDYNPGYSYEPSATPRGLKTTPQPTAPTTPTTSFPVHTPAPAPAPAATTVMSSPEYNPNPATSQSPGNGAAYAQQPSGTVMTSPEYHSAMSARAKPAATVGAPATGGINGYGPSQIPISSFSYNAPDKNEGAPADIVYNNGGPKGSVDPSNPYERAPGGWGIWSRQPQQYGRRPNLGGLKIAP